MTKKLLAVLGLVVCAAFVYQANAGVIVGNDTKLFWRDDFGAPNDSYVEAAPGDTVFVQVEVNNNQWSSTYGQTMKAWFDGSVIDALNVAPEFLPYAHLKDYPNVGAPSDSEPDPEILQLDFTGGNVYIFTAAAGPGGTFDTAFDWIGTYGKAGMLLGYYIPIRSDAPYGETTFNIKVTGDGFASWMGVVWSEELSDTVNTDWAMTINVVPEPATMSLLAIGGILALIRRKK